jgi:NTE family protein
MMGSTARLALLLLALAPSWAPASDCPASRLPEQAQPVRIPPSGLKLGLALGSGSTHGLAHIGVIRELEASGVDVRVVSGTSVGALIGALWASGLSGARIEALSQGGDWSHVGDFAASWQGILDNDRLRGQLEGVFAKRPIESWPRRFGAVATNLANGHRRILMSGDGAAAVQASTAVPVLYRPVVIGGENLADGVLVEPVPVDTARALGADYVIAVDAAYRPYEAQASGIPGFAFQSLHILVNALGARQARDADFAIRLDMHHKFTDCGAAAVIDAGRVAMRRAMPGLASSIGARAK